MRIKIALASSLVSLNRFSYSMFKLKEIWGNGIKLHRDDRKTLSNSTCNGDSWHSHRPHMEGEFFVIFFQGKMQANSWIPAMGQAEFHQ